MKKRSLVMAAVFASLCAAAQKMPYSLAAVSEALKSNAAVVTHLEDINYEIENVDKATLQVHKIYTVVNEDGKRSLVFSAYNTKAVLLESAELVVYDNFGKQVARYKKKDMSTVAVGEGLVEDGFVTYFQVTPPSYPVTIEVTYTQQFKSTLIIPPYHFIHEKEAVVASNFTAKVPAGMHLRYKARHTTVEPVVTTEGTNQIYKWTVTNVSPNTEEDNAETDDSKMGSIQFVSNQFSHYGHKGDLSSWQSYGTWLSNLYKGLDVLPEARQQFFKQLVQDAPNDREKVARIYNYLQQNFRYVSIQLGIGGLQPFSAAFTDSKKYGDCKALSNYMKAALNAVGIRSHVAIINAGVTEEPVDPFFPSSNFNHVILCVPRPTDSIWLECTSNTAAFNALGTFTENRNALLVTETGGVLVPTPKSKASANTFVTHNNINLQPDLSASVRTQINGTGVYRELLAGLLKEKEDDQKESLVFSLGFKQPDAFTLAALPDGQTDITMQLHRLHEFNAGSKYFIKPRLHQTWLSKLPTAENRKTDFFFSFPFEKTDTTVVKLPANFKLDALPAEKKFASKHSSYQSTYWYNQAEHAVYAATKLVLKTHKIPADDYRAVKTFFTDLAQDDAQRIVVQKTSEAPAAPAAF